MTQRIEEAQQALDAVRAHSAIQARLRRVGYGLERLAEGEQRLVAAEFAREQAEAAIAAQRAATLTLRQARTRLEGSHRDAVQLLRVALGDEHPWLAEAGVPQRRAAGAGTAERDNSLEGLIHTTRTFFAAAQGAEADVRARLGEIGMGPIAIQMAQGMVDAVELAANTQQLRMAEANEAIAHRAEAFMALDDWTRDFIAIARVALRDKPDLLEALGIKPRGRPRKPVEAL